MLKMVFGDYVGWMVEQAIEARDNEYSGDAPDSIVAVKRFNGLELHVCYIEFPDFYRIITVYDEDEVSPE